MRQPINSNNLAQEIEISRSLVVSQACVYFRSCLLRVTSIVAGWCLRAAFRRRRLQVCLYTTLWLRCLHHTGMAYLNYDPPSRERDRESTLSTAYARSTKSRTAQAIPISMYAVFCMVTVAWFHGVTEVKPRTSANKSTARNF